MKNKEPKKYASYSAGITSAWLEWVESQTPIGQFKVWLEEQKDNCANEWQYVAFESALEEINKMRGAQKKFAKASWDAAQDGDGLGTRWEDFEHYYKTKFNE